MEMERSYQKYGYYLGYKIYRKSSISTCRIQTLQKRFEDPDGFHSRCINKISIL